MCSVRKLYVEVANAKDLMPKDGEGCASPYCVLDYDGQRKLTEAKAKELNPEWNSIVDFIVFDPSCMDATVLIVSVFTGKSKAPLVKPGFLGRVRIRGSKFAKKGDESLVYHKLQRRSILSQVKGEIGIKVWWCDETEEPPAEAATPAVEAAPDAAAQAAVPTAEPAAEATPAATEPAAEATPAATEPAPTEAPAKEPEPAPASSEATTEPATDAAPPAAEGPAPAPGPAPVAPEPTLKAQESSENAVLLSPVYWDHNLPFAYEVPWNNFIPSSVLENPYVNLPMVWLAR